MNNNHILKWARASGINVHVYTDAALPASIDDEAVRALKKFAEHAAKYERQLCAKICKRQAQDLDEHEVWIACAELLSNQIRARRQA
jgi:hypothetical protein